MSRPSLWIYFNHTETLEVEVGSKSWALGTQYSLGGQTEVGVGLGKLFQRKAVIRPDPKSLSPSSEFLPLGYWFSGRLQSPYSSMGSAVEDGSAE